MDPKSGLMRDRREELISVGKYIEVYGRHMILRV